ncbi:monovalent cation/H+ antiporter subunit D [Polymorphobacter sp.]|uniref:monovalent cation/H+ antiporter subunit D n=1 Tax=Polymorphobacter sp. TaxID=1909290 RepID=UPI003F729F6E
MGVWPILPVLVPFTAALLMLLANGRLAVQRGLALAAAGLGLVAAVQLLIAADAGTIAVYRLGDWPAPYGIVLVVDRLAALMVLLVSALGLPALLMAIGGSDSTGKHFHPLFQLQLAGLTGAFLTGDLFNLFVFFEILLLASYALLMHGPAAAEAGRVRAGLVYVVLNLVGSSLFLIALALLYGTLGTLNLADLGRLLPQVPPDDTPLVRTALALLAAVFLLKAAVLPMSLWLPHVYARAPAAAAALFVILTKVGIVMLLRVSVTGFGDAPVARGLLTPWLPALALATVVFGTLGALAARRLVVVAAQLVLVSAGMLLFALGHGGERGTAALLYYLPQSTLVGAGLFLLAAHVEARRPGLGDRFTRGASASGRAWLGPAYLVLAIGLAGLPPLSGFLGKLMLLQAVATDGWRLAWWTALLASGLAVTLAFARAAGPLFWQASEVPAVARLPDGLHRPAPALGLWLLVAAGPLLVILARPASDYAAATAAQLHQRQAYLDAVLPPDEPILRERRP